MPPASAVSLSTTLATGQALIEQFLRSLDSTPSSQHDATASPSPLHLLTAATTSVKSSTTKLSLLTITAPFTPSAVVSILQPLNTSILPSLVTSTLLTTPALYPVAFCHECRSLVRICLRDLTGLLALVQVRAGKAATQSGIEAAEQQAVTEATGKVWETCDLLLRLSNDGVVDFAVRKARQWLDLMKDAVKELEEWDPAEDDLDEHAWVDSGDDDEAESATKDQPVDVERATISAGVREQALKVLSRIPQSVHVVVKQRLEKLPRSPPSLPREPAAPMPTRQKHVVDLILTKTRQVSDCIDESAEGMYLGDLELCLKKAGEARALTIDIVESVLEPWVAGSGESKEDQYIRKALRWVQQVQPDAPMATKEVQMHSKPEQNGQIRAVT